MPITATIIFASAIWSSSCLCLVTIWMWWCSRRC